MPRTRQSRYAGGPAGDDGAGLAAADPRRSALLLGTLFVGCAVITYLRDPNLYRLPTAAYEDGRDFFAYFYNERGLSSILRRYNGYVSLLPNAVGFLAVRLPTPAVPYALALFPLSVTAFAFAGFASTVYRSVVPSDALRAAACLILALAPLANRQFVSTTAYSIWGLLFVLILVALRRSPRRAGGAGVAMAVQAAMICSHPLSIVLTPVYLTRLGIEWGRGWLARAYHSGLAAIALGYQLFGVESARERLGDLGTIARLSAHFIVERVVFNTLFSDRASRFYRRQGLESRILLTAVVATVVVLLVVVLARRHLGRGELGFLVALSYLIVALTVAYAVGRDATAEVLDAHAGQRYFWVQRLCFLLLLVVAGPGALRRIPRQGARVAIALALLAVVGLQLARLNRLDNSKYASRAGVGRKLQQFTREVAEQEERGEGVAAVLPRGRWSIDLRRPAPAEVD